MTELNEQIEKCNYNVKQLEKQVPVHYLYDENNIIYGFGKTNDANIFRLILITDPYENTIFFNYASDETNKITSIRDSNKEYVSFKYNDNNLLVSIQDARDRKITLNYNNNNQIKSITFADNSTSYFYYDNDTLTTLLNQSGFGAKFTYSNNKVTKIESLSILDKVENGKIYYKQINQNSLLNNTTQNNALIVNNPNSLETFNFEITNFTPYLLKDKTLYITYNNYMSTTLTNAKNKSITYNFDKFGNTTTTYENQIIEANDANTTKVTEYSYTNDLLTEKITKYINSKNYLKDVSFNPSHIVKTDSIMLGETLCNDATAFYEDKKTLNIFKISNFIARQKAESVHVPDSEITAINTINNYCDNKILIVSGWAKADSAFILTNEDKNNYPLYLQNRKFEIRVEVTYQNTTENDKPQIFSKSFDWRNTNWQYCAVPVIIQKNKNVASITCYIDYTNNTGSISYTNLDLYEGDYEHLEYNGKKQPKLKYSGHSNWITEYFYDNDNDNLIKEYLFDKSYFNDEDKFKHGYLTSYEYNKNNSLIKSINPLGIVKENIYDDKGRVIKSLTYHYSQPANVFYEEHNFDDFGNEAFSTNELGEKSSTYEYLNNTNITSTSIDYLNNKTSYGYSKGDILLQSSTTVNGIDNANTYGYTLDFLTSLNHNDFDIIYNYDNLGRTSSINISDNNYLSYEYHILENDINPDNSYLSEFREEILTLATGEVYKKVFNEYDNLLKLFYKLNDTSPFTEDNLILINSYDKFGNLIKTIENLNNKTIIHNYSIDKFGNVNNQQTFIDNNPIPEINISNSYDSEHDKISSCHISISGKALNYQYSYSTDPYKTLQNISLPNNFNQAILYDKLGRIDTLNLLNDNTTLTKKYTYLKNGDHTSNLVSLLSFANNNIINQKLSYKYDIKGNLTEVRSNNHLLARYFYDSLSRIVREDNSDLQKTFTFSYDAGGNITCKNEYTFTLIDNLETLTPTNTLTYFYPITGWRDQLIGLNNEEFEYDNLGNPFVYRDKTLCWSHGRQLDKFDNVNFTYNANGIRTSKTFMGNTTKYYLNGNRILAQSDTINTLYFHYGIDGVTGFNLDGIEYLYKKNIQNDIIGIYDTDGNEIVKYSYDAWGNHKTYVLNDTGYVDISLKNTYTENGSLNKDIAEINPFRYRSYYYDSETNLYYLNSRYYDPEIGRFINADDISTLDVTKMDLNGINLYCYCLNNPVNLIDENGKTPLTLFLVACLIGAIIGATSGAIYGGLTAAANGDDIGTGIASGFFSGLIMGAGAGVATFYLAPVMIGAGATTLAGITIGGIGSSLFIGTTIAVASGFLGGVIGDLTSQLVTNGWKFDNLDSESILKSGLQGSIINIFGSFISSIAGPLSNFQSGVTSVVFSNITGALSLLFDSIRKRRKK